MPELNDGKLVFVVERAAGSQANVGSLPKYNTEAFDPQEICEAIEDLSKGC